jgi:hypothetical protein
MGLTATAEASGIELAWTANSEPDLAGYEVYRSTTKGGPYEKINTSRIGESFYADTRVSANTTYHYVVRAVDVFDKLSPPSGEATATSGAAPGYRDIVLDAPRLQSYWRLGEASGTTAADEKGAHPARTWAGSPSVRTGP